MLSAACTSTMTELGMLAELPAMEELASFAEREHLRGEDIKHLISSTHTSDSSPSSGTDTPTTVASSQTGISGLKQQQRKLEGLSTYHQNYTFVGKLVFKGGKHTKNFSAKVKQQTKALLSKAAKSLRRPGHLLPAPKSARD
eukprot:jgi/Botrbrau1/12215/Bobra.0197s0009.1